VTGRLSRRAPRAARIALATVLLALPGVGSQAQSLDAASAEAARFLDADVRAYRRNCPGEAITVSVQSAELNPAVVARTVSLAAGSCFGQPGQNAYLVAKGPQGWERILSAEPGFIEVQAARHGGYADLVLASLGMCRFTYRWNGRGYVKAGSEGCGALGRPPTARTLSDALRGRR
jgi:hypothetical protein